MNFSISFVIIFFIFQDFFIIVRSQAFTPNEIGCVAGSSGNDCPKKWEVGGGPGSTGNQRESQPTRVFCSPSCTSSSNPSVCSLIVVLHGIYSNPDDMIWLLLGSDLNGGGETFNEDSSHGGPFCISFHKSADFPWSYSCEGDDADHLEAFILWARDYWPIDHGAVFMHGFSSGGIMINQLMNNYCKVEPLIAGVAPYGSGNVQAPPTTKAAYLIGMGTHDNIVAYKYTFLNNRYYPSCDCNTNLGDPGGCLNGIQYLSLQGEQLAAGIASLRGYQGTLYGNQPTVTSTLDLINNDQGFCQNSLANCIGPFQIDTGYDCNTLPQEETDVIEYPVDPTSNAGPVVVWRMNLHNHDYPNKRRSSWGATEMFFQLRLFFSANKGIKNFSGARSVTQINSNAVCASPDSYDLVSNPESLAFRRTDWENFTPEECRLRCLREDHCTEAFYLNPGPQYPTACQMFYTPVSCSSIKNWSGVHFKATTSYEPTSPPSPTLPPTLLPTPAPTTTPPITPAPTLVPTSNEELCSSAQILDEDAEAGYACLVNGDSIGDSNADFSENDCATVGGSWTSYSCSTANDFWFSVGGSNWEHAGHFGPIWRTLCCQDGTPTVGPTSAPTKIPTTTPTATPTEAPSLPLTNAPSTTSTHNPSKVNSFPTNFPSNFFSKSPTQFPTSSSTTPPTFYPSSSPTPSPTKSPTKSPTPSEGFCPASQELNGEAEAGYACLVDGISVGDSNAGYTQNECASNGGTWTLYSCATASEFWYSVGGSNWEHAEYFEPIWGSLCCEEPVTGFCPDTQILDGDAEAGYACLVDGESVGDSNADYTQNECASNGGTWTLYSCATADEFWYSVGGSDWEYGEYFEPIWGSLCCQNESKSEGSSTEITASPSISPTEFPTAPPTVPLCKSGESYFSIEIQFDSKAAQDRTRIRLRRFINGKFGLFMKKNSFANNQYYVWGQCMSTNICYRFIIREKGNDGICCDHGNGFYKLDFNGQSEFSTYENGSKEIMHIGNCGAGKNENFDYTEIDDDDGDGDDDEYKEDDDDENKKDGDIAILIEADQVFGKLKDIQGALGGLIQNIFRFFNKFP